MAVEVHCPYCNSKTHTRTSIRITPTATTAQVKCRGCDARLDVSLQITGSELPTYAKDVEVFKWTEFKPANEPKFQKDQLPLAL
jgi:transcription elongation factor Elf1